MYFPNIITSQRFIFLCLICGVLAGLLFVPGVTGSFILDDGSNIVDNPGVHLQEVSFSAIRDVIISPQPGGLSRILPTLTFALDYWRGGGEPEAFKFTNILIHVVTVYGMVLFLRLLVLAAGARSSVAESVALLVALAWAVHPLQVSSVLYVVQRMQTLATLFLVLAMWAYLRGRLAQLGGGAGRKSFLVSSMFWLLALGCKEDAVLLPAYLLLIELAVLQFRSASPAFSRKLRGGYLVAAAVGLVAYALVVVPHYWEWGSYPGRDFSSYERLLTQARILMMYLGQIVFPLPANMPFYYDWIVPSTGLLQPVATLSSMISIVVMLLTAWWLRLRRPLFAFGVLFFFASHFITSNILNLELAFEHRNHLGLLGVVLAMADILMALMQRLRMPRAIGVGVCGLLLMLMSTATLIRAHDWGNRLRLASLSSELAPGSARAWNSLCLTYYAMGGGVLVDNPRLGDAIDACGKGAQEAPYSLASFTNFIVFKSARGDIQAQDWSGYLDRLRSVNMGPENRQSLWIIVSNVRAGVKLDEEGVFEALGIFQRRLPLRSGELTALGYFVLGHTSQPDRALGYFLLAMQKAEPSDPLAAETIAEMRKQGRGDWANELEEALRTREVNAPSDGKEGE